MILRGDGKTGVRKNDCFTARDFPIGKCQVALMNPPFPHKSSDTPPEKFVERALEALDKHGILGIIVPTSFVVKKEFSRWRENILQINSLLSVCQLPDELFQPYSSSTTSVIFMEKGIKHNPKNYSAFVRLENDGLTLKKGIRVARSDGSNQIPNAIDSILNKKTIPGFSGVAPVMPGDEWAPGAYIPAAELNDSILLSSVDELLRRSSSFYIRYAKEIAHQRLKISTHEVTSRPYREILSDKRLKNSEEISTKPGTIGASFDISYGQKALHSRENLPPGDSLIISPTEQYNGCYGWHDFPDLISPPFITVAQTGSIGEAFVQTEPCGVNDDCVILLPKEGLNIGLAELFIAASTIRLEKWRFNYGRKLTPTRITSFPFVKRKKLTTQINKKIEHWQKINNDAISLYE
jgi:hypothetical protein